jgi:hypothetical protein
MKTTQKTASQIPHSFFTAAQCRRKNALSACHFSASSLFLFLFTFYFFALGGASAETVSTWVLGAEKFKYSQVQDRTKSEQDIAEVFPQLILEQIASGEIRSLPAREVLNRKLDTLLSARLSLFLQLSKEVQTRDALVLTKEKPRDLEKAISDENKKIAAIQKQIGDNLAEADKTASDSAPAIEAEEQRETQIEAEQSGTDGGTKTVVKSASDKSAEERKKQFSLPFPFFRKDSTEMPVNENVSLYKTDSTALFAASAAAMEQGYQSRTFEREVVSAKINGLLTGSIVSYGEYAAVTAELHLYPGGTSAGTITEVGLLQDPLSIAKRIARYLSPKIANSMPVMLEFSIMPEEAAEHASVTIDGLVYSSVLESAVVEAGIHTVTIESDNFEMASVSYKFTGNTRFTVRATLVPAVSGKVYVRLRKFRDGIFYANGVEEGPADEQTRGTQILVNGKAVLGVFTAGEGDDKQSAFYYIPAEMAQDGKKLVVNAKPYDRAANIDKRRRSMYTAYSALVCSLPLYFYCYGNFTAANNGLSLQRLTSEKAIEWQRRSLITGGVSVVFGTWFVVELARYLFAANEVLPAASKIDKSPLQSIVQDQPPEQTLPAAESPAVQYGSADNSQSAAEKQPEVKK